MNENDKTKASLVPIVVEKEGAGERSYDIYSRLLKDRIIILGEEITDDVANAIVAQLLLLEGQDSEQAPWRVCCGALQRISPQRSYPTAPRAS